MNTRLASILLCSIALLSLSTMTANADTRASLVTPRGALSVVQLESMSAQEIADRLIQDTGSDASLIVDKEQLISLVRTRGTISLPVATTQTAADISPARTFAALGLNDASITYDRPLASNARTTLTVCRSWGPTPSSGCARSGGDGNLLHRENTRNKFGWSDSDGYYHPSNTCETRATYGPLSYTFGTTGWVKLSGTAGFSAWLVQMWC